MKIFTTFPRALFPLCHGERERAATMKVNLTSSPRGVVLIFFFSAAACSLTTPTLQPLTLLLGEKWSHHQVPQLNAKSKVCLSCGFCSVFSFYFISNIHKKSFHPHWRGEGVLLMMAEEWKGENSI